VTTVDLAATALDSDGHTPVTGIIAQIRLPITMATAHGTRLEGRHADGGCSKRLPARTPWPLPAALALIAFSATLRRSGLATLGLDLLTILISLLDLILLPGA